MLTPETAFNNICRLVDAELLASRPLDKGFSLTLNLNGETHELNVTSGEAALSLTDIRTLSTPQLLAKLAPYPTLAEAARAFELSFPQMVRYLKLYHQLSRKQFLNETRNHFINSYTASPTDFNFADFAKEHSVSLATVYRWRNEFLGGKIKSGRAGPKPS